MFLNYIHGPFPLYATRSISIVFLIAIMGWLDVASTLHNNHTEKSFPSLIESNRNQIVFTNFRLIWNQTDAHLVLNQSENGKYYLISVWFDKISKRFLCVWKQVRVKYNTCSDFAFINLVYLFIKHTNQA